MAEEVAKSKNPRKPRVKKDTNPKVKNIFLSKTIWVNLLALIAFFAQRHYGFVIDESLQVEILGAINILLRIITNEPVKWRK